MDPLQIKIEEIGQNPIKKEEEQTQIKKEEQGEKEKKKTVGVTRRIRRGKELIAGLKQ
jgi:hypothetical protein